MYILLHLNATLNMYLHLPCEIYMCIFDFLDIQTQLSFLNVFPFLSEYVFLNSNFDSDDNEITKYNRYKLYKCSNINKLHDNIKIKHLEYLFDNDNDADNIIQKIIKYQTTIYNCKVSLIKLPKIPNIFPKLTMHLTFGSEFNQEIEESALPKTLTNLTFGWKFNQEIKENILPNSLTHLTFGWEFNKEIKENILPKTLTHLTFNDYFNVGYKAFHYTQRGYDNLYGANLILTPCLIPSDNDCIETLSYKIKNSTNWINAELDTSWKFPLAGVPLIGSDKGSSTQFTIINRFPTTADPVNNYPAGGATSIWKREGLAPP